jgi:hypothetical protein
MDQVTLVDNHYMTREFLESKLVENTNRIKELEEHIQKVTQRSYSDSAERNRMVEAMKEWTFEALEAREISETNAEEIAEIMGFDLTKEVEVEVSVTYTMTVNVGPNEDVETIVHDIDFDTVSYNDDSISWLSSEIGRVDY